MAVSDESVTYEPGGCTELGCSSPPGTYGVEEQSDLVRIVWHHSSFNEQRTFQISYVMTGVTVAYDDVVDVNLQVWGDQWAVGLDSLEARMELPEGAEPGEIRVYGHPYSVDGETSLGSRSDLSVVGGEQYSRLSVGRDANRLPQITAPHYRRGDRRSGRGFAGDHCRRGRVRLGGLRRGDRANARG